MHISSYRMFPDHVLLFNFLFSGNCMSEFMGLICGKYEAKVSTCNKNKEISFNLFFIM